jgi:hypothetical protein
MQVTIELYIQLPDRYLGDLVLAILNNANLNIHLYKSLCGHVSSFLLEGEIADHMKAM